jgi:hypothetical protein
MDEPVQQDLAIPGEVMVLVPTALATTPWLLKMKFPAGLSSLLTELGIPALQVRK